MTACRQFSRFTLSHTLSIFFLLICFVLAPSQPASGQILQRPLAFEGARIVTMDGRVIEQGTMVVAGDKIRAVGSDVKLPLLAKKIDVAGTTITPGLIDVSSILGRTGGRASGGNAAQRAEDAFDRYDTTNVVEALQQGVTALFLSPQGPQGISGTGAVIRLTRDSSKHDAVGSVLKSQAALCINLGSANKPVARVKMLQAIEKTFRGAQQYRRSLETYDEELAEYAKKLEEKQKKAAAKKTSEAKKEPAQDPKKDPAAAKDEPEKKPEAKKPAAKPATSDQLKKPRRPTRSVANELLLRALDGEIPVRIVAERSSDILNALELADTFSLQLVLEGAAEAHLVAEQVAASKATIVIGRMDLPAARTNDVQRRRSDQPSAVYDRHGIPWVVGSGAASAQRTRFVLQNAQLAASAADTDDSPADRPLALLTAAAADALQVAEIGRLRPGNLADFVVWSGDPLDPASNVMKVFVGGKEVFAATD